MNQKEKKKKKRIIFLSFNFEIKKRRKTKWKNWSARIQSPSCVTRKEFIRREKRGGKGGGRVARREGGQEVGRIFRLPRLDRSLVPRQTLNIHYYGEIGARAHLDPSLLPSPRKKPAKTRKCRRRIENAL